MSIKKYNSFSKVFLKCLYIILYSIQTNDACFENGLKFDIQQQHINAFIIKFEM